MKKPCARCGHFDADKRQCIPCKRYAERMKYSSDEDYRQRCIAYAARTKAENPEGAAEYQRRLYESRRAAWVAYLGGVCVACGTAEDLEFDHVDYRLKSFNVAIKWSRPWRILQEELDKCQLLCGPCHKVKTAGDRLLRRQRALT